MSKILKFLIIIAIVVLISLLIYNRESEVINTEIDRPLLPSIAVFPPHDIGVFHEEGRTVIRFGATHWNKGAGTFYIYRANNPSDGSESYEVFQKIFRKDGTVQNRSIGEFVWHHEHNHYHLTNFMEYSLHSLDDPDRAPLYEDKVTYCLRDNGPIDLTLPGAPEDPVYELCEADVQGISVGWRGTYGYEIPGQDIDMTGVPSGRYELRIVFDPLNLIKELDRSDNTSYAILRWDAQSESVEVLSKSSSEESYP